MKKIAIPLILGCLIIILLANISHAKRQPLLIDNFEDGNYTERPTWYEFDQLELTIKDNNLAEASYLESKSLRLRGKTSDWYMGGAGLYLGVNAQPYNTIKCVIKGNGPDSGNITFELFDDDNENFELETDAAYPSYLVFDDKWTYTQKVSWNGWRVVIIPFSKFRDANPTIGDNVLNLNQNNGSGGLIQLQLLAFAAEKKGRIDIQIDSIKMYYSLSDEIY